MDKLELRSTIYTFAQYKEILMNNGIFIECNNKEDAKKLVFEYCEKNKDKIDEILNKQYFFSKYNFEQLKNLADYISKKTNIKMKYTKNVGKKVSKNELFK